jgi:RNA polymerase sigma factor (sigma-70 family)
VNEKTDSELLRAYSRDRSEAAFAELVRRHLDFVHSAAQRMVCDSQLAQDVSQAVFLVLAGDAVRLAEHPVLSGWLHRTTRNIASQTVRTDVRRRAREREAATMNELLSAGSEISWQQIAPHLDEAIAELNEADQEALLLRYFERKSAREIAAILGGTEEGVQKRVSRAVDRVRERFAKRGITTAAGAIAAVITANGVQAAPVGLALTISTAAAAAGTAAATAAATASKAVAMTTLQKCILGGALLAAVGTGIYEALEAASLRNRVQTLRQDQATLKGKIEQLTNEREASTRQLAGLRGENERLNQNTAELLKLRAERTRLRNDPPSTDISTDPYVQKVLGWKGKEIKLRQLFEERPEQKVPELTLLPDLAWFTQATESDLETDQGIRSALSLTRKMAQNMFAPMMQHALEKFVTENGGNLPENLLQLKNYFREPVDDALLLQYQLMYTGKYSDVPANKRASIVTSSGVVDKDLDPVWHIGPAGFGATLPKTQ